MLCVSVMLVFVFVCLVLVLVLVLGAMCYVRVMCYGVSVCARC